MKKLFFVLVSFLFIENQLDAQFNFGLIGGISSVDIKPSTLNITDKNKLDSFSLAFDNADYGFHFGGFVRISIQSFYIQPEVVFNSNRTTFKYKKFKSAQFYDTLFLKERYQYLDIPLMLGLKLGILRFNAGPVAHIFINNKSELTDLNGYESKFQTATFGYQMGIGFDLSKIMFDLRYEGNFTKFGEHINFNGTKYAFDKGPSRLIATLGLKF
jgi:hypothetical protein